MNPLICGAWDGVHVWLQWEDVAPVAGYRIHLRFRKTEADEWGFWMPIQDSRPYMKHWFVIPTHREGWLCQARVVPAAESVDRATICRVSYQWQVAQEVTFQRSRCRFHFASSRRRFVYRKGQEIHGIIDGAACHYSIGEDFEIGPGEEHVSELTAAITSGYCQLDYPGHFEVTPALGLTIRNLEASIDDVQETGRDWTRILSLPRDAPVKLLISAAANKFKGNS